MAIALVQVDAFTDERFRGNPAAVCFLEELRPDAWLQDVAGEMNLSETAFLLPQPNEVSLRWFTPRAEVDLCGHATLASAHALWELGRLSRDEQARFRTRSGLLTARLRGAWIEMDFPAEPAAPVSAPSELVRALGGPVTFVGMNRMDYLVQTDSPVTLRGLTPDMRALGTLDARGVIVTSPSDDPAYDFLSRYFAPRFGIDEDPVTGSAHCALAPYWGEKLGKQDLVGFQASPRGGVVRVRTEGPRVLLSGQAITVMRGELL